jgi:hypothetical protein
VPAQRAARPAPFELTPAPLKSSRRCPPGRRGDGSPSRKRMRRTPACETPVARAIWRCDEPSARARSSPPWASLACTKEDEPWRRTFDAAWESTSGGAEDGATLSPTSVRSAARQETRRDGRERVAQRPLCRLEGTLGGCSGTAESGDIASSERNRRRASALTRAAYVRGSTTSCASAAQSARGGVRCVGATDPSARSQGGSGEHKTSGCAAVALQSIPGFGRS